MLLNASLSAQICGAEAIDTVDLKRHLSFLAADVLQGRAPGTQINGLDMAASYLAENAAKIGLKPGAPDFFQQVELFSVQPDKANFVAVENEKGKTVYHSNSLIDLSGSNKTLFWEGIQVILAGFGENLSDFNPEGKAIIVSQGNREDFGKQTFRWNNRLENAKIEALTQKNPKAIFIVSNPKDKQNKVFRQLSTWFTREKYVLSLDDTDKVPVIVVLPEFADKLLGGKGEYKKYLSRLAITKNDDQPESQKTIKLQTGKITRRIDAKNVLGIVEGADETLKNEYVIFMAHYDHLGVNEEGEVYNGADDNGSGTVAVLEVAEAFASLQKKPKRSIVFLWVTGEELGMLGSGFYADDPVFPLEKTVVCFNLDMVGRVFEERDTVWARSPKRVKDFDGLYTLSNDIWPGLSDLNQKICKELQLVPDTTLPEGFLRSSDHYSFHKNGIPIMNYATGYHADYHKVSDDDEKINFQKIKRVAELCFRMGMEVANTDKIERKPAKQ